MDECLGRGRNYIDIGVPLQIRMSTSQSMIESILGNFMDQNQDSSTLN